MINKILFVENELENDNPMSTCYKLKCDRIKNYSSTSPLTSTNIEIKYYNIGSNNLDVNLNDYQIVLFGCRSIYLYKVYKNKIKEELKKKFEQIVNAIEIKFFIIQDMHQKTYGNIETLCEILNNNNFNIIFTFYNNAEARLIRKLTPKCKYYHLPHHIDTNIFKNYNENGGFKDIDILLFGSIHPRHYPFRKRLFDLILNNKDKFSNIYWIEYNSSIFNPSHCESGLAKLLNRSKICIATKSRYDYLVGKYFEISSSNCLIAGDIPTDGKELLDSNILELDNKMDDNTILTKIIECLNNYQNYTEKITNMKNITDTQYNLDEYINRLLNIILFI